MGRGEPFSGKRDQNRRKPVVSRGDSQISMTFSVQIPSSLPQLLRKNGRGLGLTRSLTQAFLSQGSQMSQSLTSMVYFVCLFAF